MNAFFYDELLPELQQLVRERLRSGTRALLGMTCKAEVKVFTAHFQALYGAERAIITRDAWNADDPETMMRLTLDRLRGCPRIGLFDEYYIPWLPRALAAEGLFELYANTCRHWYPNIHNVPYTADLTYHYSALGSDDLKRLGTFTILKRIRRDAEWAAYHGHGTEMLKWCLTAHDRDTALVGIFYVVAGSPIIHEALAATGNSEALRLLFAGRQMDDLYRVEIVASAICYAQPAIADEYSLRSNATPWYNLIVQYGFRGMNSLTTRLFRGIILASHAGCLQWLAKMDELFAAIHKFGSGFEYMHGYINALLVMVTCRAWTDDAFGVPAEIVVRVAYLLWAANARSWFGISDDVYEDYLDRSLNAFSSRLHPGYHDIYKDIRTAFAEIAAANAAPHAAPRAHVMPMLPCFSRVLT